MIKNSEIESYRLKTLDSSFNGAVFSYEPQVVYENFIHKKSHTYLMLKEKFVTNQMVFYLQQNHYMTEKFYDKIDWFREFGITNYILTVFLDPLYYRKMPHESTSKPLVFRELSAVFYIWMGGLGFGLVVCVIEIRVGCKKPIINVRKRRRWKKKHKVLQKSNSEV